jgi:hypothetical protein
MAFKFRHRYAPPCGRAQVGDGIDTAGLLVMTLDKKLD